MKDYIILYREDFKKDYIFEEYKNLPNAIYNSENDSITFYTIDKGT